MRIMNVLGLKIRGNFCFYTINPKTAIVVGVRHKHGKWRPIPKKIGGYTVRGIHKIHKLPHYYATIQQFTDKEKNALCKKLEPFKDPVYGSLEQLPETVEFVGYHLDTGKSACSIPRHIRYIDTLHVCGESVTFPRDLLYLGKIERAFLDSLRSISFNGEASGSQPHLPASAYLGSEVEDIPQIAGGAFAECRSLNTLRLSPQLQKLGANLFWESSITYHLPVDIGSFPADLRRVEADALAYCRVETLHYPSDIHEELRSQSLRLGSINRLVIDDLTGLEEYCDLIGKGEAPQRHPAACLYHLLRAAKTIQINVPMKRIPDGMFKDCTQLSALRFQGIPFADLIDLSQEITAIGAEAFQNCKSIKHITTGQLIQSIGQRAFMGSSISRFTVYGLVRQIGREAFRQCTALRILQLYSKQITIAEDAFAGCDNLELSPEVRDRIADMPCFPSYRPVEEKRNAKVAAILKKGDLYLQSKPVSRDAKKNALNTYCSALQADHYRMETMNKIEALLLDHQVPLRIEPERLRSIKDSLRAYGSDAMLAALEHTLRSLDDVSVILCAAGDIPSVVRSFSINHNPEAAMVLCESFCDALKRNHQISLTARGKLYDIVNALLPHCSRQSLQQRTSQVRRVLDAQKQRGVISDQEFAMGLLSDGSVEQHLTAAYFRKLYDTAAEQSNAADGALWADIVKSLDPSQKLPKIKPRPQPKKTTPTPPPPRPAAPVIPLWVPTIPDPIIPTSKPVRYIGDETEEEFNRRTSQLLSDYNAEQEAKRIAKEIEESMFSPPGTYGHY